MSINTLPCIDETMILSRISFDPISQSIFNIPYKYYPSSLHSVFLLDPSSSQNGSSGMWCHPAVCLMIVASENHMKQATGCGYCSRGWGKECQWPWYKKHFRMTKEGLKAIEDD